MKTAAPLQSAAAGIVLRPAKSLTIHKLARAIPMLPVDAPEREELRASIELRGLLQPLIVTPQDEIVDGRVRFEDGRKLGLTEFPCIVHPDAEAAAIIVESLVARRHYTKGARAYLLAHLLEEAAEANKVARADQLLIGKTLRNPTELGFGKTEGDFAMQFGFSAELIRQAKAVHVQFRKADKARVDWRGKFPDLVKQADALAAGREAEPLPSFAEAYPDDLRARFEPKILAGDAGLGAVIQAIVGKLSTEGMPKGSSSHAQLLFDGWDTAFQRLTRWEKLQPKERESFVAKVPTWVKSIPADLRQVIARELLADS